jgi:hypothetical protein
MARAAPVLAGPALGKALLPVYGVRSGMIQSQALFLLTAYVVGNIGFQIPFGRLLDRWSAPLILAACGIFP